MMDKTRRIHAGWMWWSQKKIYKKIQIRKYIMVSKFLWLPIKMDDIRNVKMEANENEGICIGQ